MDLNTIIVVLLEAIFSGNNKVIVVTQNLVTVCQ